jgi:rhomboid protease GluP
MCAHEPITALSADVTEITFYPPSAEKTLHWITVLSAVGLLYRLSRENETWQLHVPAEQAEKAIAEIRTFEQEEAAAGITPPPKPPSPRMIRAAHWSAFWCAYVLTLFYLGLGSFDPANPLHIAGAMSRTDILEGQWWRSITALTLHSGLSHLLGNSVFLLFFGQAVMRELGRGIGIAFILTGGIAGNYLAALTASPYQRSVGASTACFAALGIISILQAAHVFRRYRTWSAVWRQTWIPIAGGIALLGLTGTSPGSDIAAHLFGFLSGACLALPAATRPQIFANISVAMQWTITMITASLLPLAWTLALLNR